MNEIFKKFPSVGFALAALVAFVAAYYFGSRTGKAANANEAGDELASAVKANPLSYDYSTYVSLADKLETAMNGFGDDEEAIYNVFTRMKSKADVLKLIEVFGNRIYVLWMAHPLTYWLSGKLTADEIQHINDILSRNNIDFSF